MREPTIADVLTEMREGMTELRECLVGVNKRLDGIDTRLDGIERQLGRHTDILVQTQEAVHKVQQRLPKRVPA